MADRIRARFRTLQPDDIGDIWNDALFALARSALVGRFKEEGSLHGLIWKIARCRAIDFLRRQGIRSQCQEPPEETTHADRMFCFDEDISLDELLKTIREAIRTLSGRQRSVLEAFANSGFNRKDDDFVAEASKLAREPLTRTQVCEALSKGLEKVAEYLRRRGY
jgi:RNA polymerase sigma factor (sigma-70 family)